MFKNYLTYHLVVKFHRECAVLELPYALRNRLIQSLETLIHHFACSVHTPDRKEELRHLCVSLMSLRDAKESLDLTGALSNADLKKQFTVLHERLEALCLKASETENGQLRLFG